MLPLASKSVFIRSLVRTSTGEYSPAPVVRLGFSRLESALYPIGDLIEAFEGGMIQNYNDVVK
jgi:hypothetical protein